jgi:hypothetical protein
MFVSAGMYATRLVFAQRSLGPKIEVFAEALAHLGRLSIPTIAAV